LKLKEVTAYLEMGCSIIYKLVNGDRIPDKSAFGNVPMGTRIAVILDAFYGEKEEEL